jgi:hypothetical protein
MLILTDKRERSRSAIMAVQLHTAEMTGKFLTRNAVTGIGHTSDMFLITEGYEAFNGRFIQPHL